MTRMTGYLATAAGLLMASTALAQTGSGQTPADQETMKGHRTADTITCAEITAMDTAVVPDVLYFVAGYQEGNKAGMNGAGMNGAGMNGAQNMDGSPKTMSDSASGGASGSDSGTGMNGDMADSSADPADRAASASTAASVSTSETSAPDDATGETATSADTGKAGTQSGEATYETTTAGAAEYEAGTPAGSTQETGSATDEMAGDTDASAKTDMAGTSETGTDGDQMRIMRVAGLYRIPVTKILTICGDRPQDKVGDVVRQNAGPDGKTAN